MRVFIDDSGSFSWATPAISLFCGVIAPDRNAPALFNRFKAWKRSVIGKSKRELKGAELTPKQLESFSYRVFPAKDRDSRLKFVGTNTKAVKEVIVQKYRDQCASLFALTSEYVHENNPANRRLIQQYREMSGWVRNRSSANTLWINVLEALIHQSFQEVIVCYPEPEDDPEFENLEFIIDRSFIRREEHIMFWKEWLRNGLINRFNRFGVFALPNTWAERDHPFERKYHLSNELMDVSDLFQDHLNFEDSQQTIGLQIADICAHIAYRYYRGERDLVAYHNLSPRIVRRKRSSLTLIMINEDSLLKEGEDLRSCIQPLTEEQIEGIQARQLRERKTGDSDRA